MDSFTAGTIIMNNEQIKRIFSFSRTKRITLLISAIIVLLIYLIHFLFGSLFYYNSSFSAPRGLYIVTLDQTLKLGDYVILRAPDNYPFLNVAKDFNLLKQVRGFPNDTYYVTKTYVLVHNQAFPIANQSEYPQLPHLDPGSYRVPVRSHLYLNDVPTSFDSRYIGPISDDHIVYKVILVFDYDQFTLWLIKILPESWIPSN